MKSPPPPGAADSLDPDDEGPPLEQLVTSAEMATTHPSTRDVTGLTTDSSIPPLRCGFAWITFAAITACMSIRGNPPERNDMPSSALCARDLMVESAVRPAVSANRRSRASCLTGQRGGSYDAGIRMPEEKVSVPETRSIQDTVVVITGASSGVGAATARLLCSEGAYVVLASRGAERLEQLARELGRDRCLAVPTDVSSPADNRGLVNATLEHFGRLDSLVVGAGVGAYGGILDYSDEELAEMIDINFAGTVWSVRAAVPAMAESGGDIVIVASVAGLRGGGHEAVYAATKFAQVGLAGAIDRELRTQGIRVTAICPAATATEFAMGRGRTPDMTELSEWMQADDVAAAISFSLHQPRRLRTTQWHLWSAAENS